MKLYINRISVLALLALSLASSSAIAEDAPVAKSHADTLLFISPNDYSYSVHLLHPYYNFWFAQGPLLEPVALKALQKDTPEISLCKANETANTIIRIKPNLFYNPQMGVYHSKLVATAYSGDGQLLGTYVGEAQQLGLTGVDNATKTYIQRAYQRAMQDLLTKLSVAKLSEHPDAEHKLPCGMIGGQEEPKASFY
ncbi:MAG TPA: hypothetical protein PL131_08865 [Methylotenera sp.]|nr:hypothetical protein [Methylotenera sp.]HPH05971.1 hypothetical protein [Methylotenera sp.]HPN00549.1 hypothetical protein [Methylotenera sp.]